MGRRGPGAARLNAVRASRPPAKHRRLPWKRAGLCRVGRVIAFLQWLPVTKGKLAGKRMRLLPEQREFVEAVYGTASKRGKRVIDLAVLSEPKGNGKTGLTAGLCLCHLLGPEAEPRGEVYSASIDRAMAGIVFEEMEAVIVEVPEFAERVNVQRFHKRIEVLEGDGAGSKYEALSSDARKAQGRAPSLWVYDELAQAQDGELLDNLMQGMSKRDEALGIVLSTQARDDLHPLSQLIDDGLSGVDPSTYVQLIAAPMDADPYDAQTLKACNPAWGKFLDVDDLLRQAARAQRLPALQAAFRNLRCNQRVDADDDARLVPLEVWRLGDVAVDVEKLRGRRCYAGLDLSGVRDLTALVLIFPDDQPEPAYEVVPFFWTPLEALSARRPAEEALFRQWIDAGLIEGVPGPVIRYRYVAEKLGEVAAMFDVRQIAYDRWGIKHLEQDLADLGLQLPLVPFGQGFADMTPALQRFAELALTSRLHHGGNPVLTACLAAAVVDAPSGSEMKFNKAKSKRPGVVRIDGVVALAMAIGVAAQHSEQIATSPWDDPEFSYVAVQP